MTVGANFYNKKGGANSKSTIIFQLLRHCFFSGKYAPPLENPLGFGNPIPHQKSETPLENYSPTDFQWGIGFPMDVIEFYYLRFPMPHENSLEP